MPHDFDIVCVGNATIDSFLTLHEANNCLRLIKGTNELAIKFGEKIRVDKAEILLGGDAANVAVGTSRFGLKTAIIAEIGKDEFAQKIINTLSNENVDISNILQTEGQQSSFSTIINYKGERTIFSEHVVRKHNFSFKDISAKWVYLTSLGNDWRDAYNNTVNFAKETIRFKHIYILPLSFMYFQGFRHLSAFVLVKFTLFAIESKNRKNLSFYRGPNIRLGCIQKVSPFCSQSSHFYRACYRRRGRPPLLL